VRDDLPMQVSPRVLGQLAAVFGDCVPKENAEALLEHSPQAPTNPAERVALQQAALALAGQKLTTLAQAAEKLSGGRPQTQTTTTGVAVRSPQALQLGQVAAARELTTPDGLRRVLSEKKAAELFSGIAKMDDIPHGFLEDGCLHRSHMVAKRLEEQGIHTEKIFTIPHQGDLLIDSDKARLGFTVTWYHEAVCVHVQTLTGLERRVLDPSVSDGPLPVGDWLKKMKGTGTDPALETFFLPRFAYGLSDRDAPPSAWREKDLQSAHEFTVGGGWQEMEKGYVEMGFYDGELARLAGRA
jgi:hypothetical protein